MSRFDYIKYDEFSLEAQMQLKKKFIEIEKEVEEYLPNGREKSLVLTKLEEAYAWCGKAIRNAQILREDGKVELQEERCNE